VLKLFNGNGNILTAEWHKVLQKYMPKVIFLHLVWVCLHFKTLVQLHHETHSVVAVYANVLSVLVLELHVQLRIFVFREPSLPFVFQKSCMLPCGDLVNSAHLVRFLALLIKQDFQMPTTCCRSLACTLGARFCCLFQKFGLGCYVSLAVTE